jgi:hypothetical protein
MGAPSIASTISRGLETIELKALEGWLRVQKVLLEVRRVF